MRLLRLIALLLSVALTRAARSWTPTTYPNPMIDIDKCGRKGVSSWVCDPDHIISYESANVVEGILKNIQAGDKPYALEPCGSAGLKGYQVAVALMRKMSFSGGAETAAENFARTLHDGWGVGDKACNNGVLLFLSLNDRQLYISTGAGTTSRLTFGVLGDIIDDVRPALKAKRFDDAIERGVIDIGLALAGQSVEPEGNGNAFSTDDAIGLGIFGTVVGGMLFWGVRTESRKRKRYQDCKSKLEKLKRDQAAFRGNTYNATSCPVCLEDFTEVDGSQAEPGGSDNGPSVSAAPHGPAPADGQLVHAHSGSCSGGHGGGGKKEVDEELKPLVTPGGEAIDGATATEAAAGPGAAAPSAPPLPAQRRPLVLPCGHSFCEPCITLWLEQKKVTCPICRRPFDDEDSPTADPRDAALPRSPRPDNNRNSAADPAGPAGAGGGAGPSSSSRPPCSVDDDEYGGGGGAYAPSYGVGMGGSSAPRLRLRWGGRRRGMRLQDDMLMAEMMFRLRQLRRQHPEYISDGMVSSWEQDLQNGREFNAQQLRDFQMNDPATRRALAQSGRSGSSVSFGGGGSRGGGGRGGSW